MAKITIVDVARIAGVSTATVSRAMHSPHVVRPATLERVRTVMREYGYVYNATAGDFSRRRSTVIGLLVHSSTTRIGSTIKAIQHVATEKGYPLMLCVSNFNAELERKHLQLFLERDVAGILVIGHMQENIPIIESMQQRGIPCIFLWDTHPDTKRHYIGIDNEQAFFTMTDYLIRHGHRRIGFICGINSGVERILKRFHGYKRALKYHRIPLEEELVQPVTSSFPNGKSAMESLLALPKPPGCVFCASDVLAMGAMSAAYEAKLSIPDDISIVGFDNSDHAPYTCPPLSTVEVPGEEMGRIAIDALMRLIQEEDKSPIQITLPTQLLIRGSTK